VLPTVRFTLSLSAAFECHCLQANATTAGATASASVALCLRVGGFYRGTHNGGVDDGMVVSHQINPSLQRLLALAGADVEQWFRDMEKPRERAAKRGDGADDLKSTGQPTLSQYFLSQHCAVCDELTQRKGLHGRRFYSLCDDCEQDPQVRGVASTPRLFLLFVPPPCSCLLRALFGLR
jgi:hypothetical protein